MMKDETMPESQEEESSPATSAANAKNMQMELHSKGTVLTKAWADLFSFITQYQAELTVKENAVEIAEREIDIRKKQLEDMKPVVDAGNDDVSRLQELITNKERQLHKVQSDSMIKEQMLKRVQSDLTCNQELVEKLRSELLEKQSSMVRYKKDLERYKSDLSIKEEQIQIKDSLIKKMQNQLMKENTELRDQLELERRAHELERKTHEITKRHLRDKEKMKSSTVNVTQAAVIDTHAPNPPLDLSVLEPDNFGVSNIVSLSQSPTQEPQNRTQEVQELVSQDSSSGVDFKEEEEGDQRFRWQTTDRLERKSKYSDSSYEEQLQNFTVISPKRIKVEPETAEESEVFFPLTVSDMDTINTSQAGDLTIPGQMPGTPSSGTSDSNQGPVPISGPIPSSSAMVMPPGIEGSEKNMGSELEDGVTSVWWCGLCSKYVGSKISFKSHVKECRKQNAPFPKTISESALIITMGPDRKQNSAVMEAKQIRPACELSKPFKCSECRKTFGTYYGVTSYAKVHDTNPFKCFLCRAHFVNQKCLDTHLKIHMPLKHKCQECEKAFSTKGGLTYHARFYHPKPEAEFHCAQCGEGFSSRCKLSIHTQVQQCVQNRTSPNTSSSAKKCTQSFRFPDRD